MLDHLDAITAQRLKQIGVATFFYAGLRMTEGVGLVLEKVWAEYLTVGVTIAFLPWEVYEIARHTDWMRVVRAGGEPDCAGVPGVVAADAIGGWKRVRGSDWGGGWRRVIFAFILL